MALPSFARPFLVLLKSSCSLLLHLVELLFHELFDTPLEHLAVETLRMPPNAGRIVIVLIEAPDHLGQRLGSLRRKEFACLMRHHGFECATPAVSNYRPS